MVNLSTDKACEDECPVKKTAEIIEGKWTTLIIRELLPGKKRYSELQRSLAGISPRMLAARLKLLQDKQLVARTVYPTIPPTTEYQLTELGYELKAVLAAMAEFGVRLPASETVKE